MVAGPERYPDRDYIVDTLIDAMCDIGPERILSGDTGDVCMVVGEVIGPTGMYTRYYPEQKYGNGAVLRRDLSMIQQSSHMLVFDPDSPDVKDIMYYADRYHLSIIEA